MNDRKLSKKQLFESCPVPQAVLRLALPTMAGQIILVIYNMADTFFVGLTGSDEMISAVTICMPAFMILSAISNLFGIGASSVIGNALGAGKDGTAKNASAYAFWGCLCASAAYSLATLLLLDLFIDLLGGTNPEVHRYAREYLLYTVVIGGVFTVQGALLAHLIRSEGRALHSSAGIMLGGLLNIALDPLFMFVILPKGREPLGAAIATLISNLFSLIYFIAVLIILRQKK